MAFTVTTQLKSVFGNARVAIVKVTTDAVSGSVQAPGIGYIFAATVSPISMQSYTSGPAVKINTTVASAAANGTVLISNVTSGDDFFLTIYGRS